MTESVTTKTVKTIALAEDSAWAPMNDIKTRHTTPNCWKVIRTVLTPETRRTLLYGPPGTGKTRAAITEGLRPGQSVQAVTLTDETPATDLLGRYTLRNAGGGQAEMVWQDGIAITAWRNGDRLVINEIDHGGPDVQSLLHVILDDMTTACITLPTGETVRPTAGFQVVATMNGRPLDLPQALKDRFPVTVLVNEVHPDALALLPTELREMARNSVLASDPTQQQSIRIWLEFAALAERTSIHLAAAATFGDNAAGVLAALRTSMASVSKP